MTATLPNVSEYTADEQRELDRAEQAADGANRNMWIVAEVAAGIVGKRDGLTAELGRRIKRSVDTVESLAKGYRLFVRLLQKYPSQAEVWREELYLGHFSNVGRKWASGWISLTDAANYLHMAVRESLSVDDLRKKLPGKDNTDSIRMMKGDIKALDRKYLNAPRLNIPDDVIRAVRLLRGRLARATK